MAKYSAKSSSQSAFFAQKRSNAWRLVLEAFDRNVRHTECSTWSRASMTGPKSQYASGNFGKRASAERDSRPSLTSRSKLTRSELPAYVDSDWYGESA